MSEASESRLDGHLTPLIRTIAFGARTIARSITRVRVEGALDEIPKEGPVILAANHVSNGDAVILGAWLTKRLGRRIHWLGKKEMFEWPVVGWVFRNGGVHPVDRGAADRRLPMAERSPRTRVTSCGYSPRARAARRASSRSPRMVSLC